MELSTALWIIGILVSALSTLGMWAWNHTHKRIDGKADKNVAETLKRIEDDVRMVNDKLDRKADVVEMNRQRDHITDLFQSHQQIRTEMSQGFAGVNDRMNTNMLTLVEKIGEIKGSTK